MCGIRVCIAPMVKDGGEVRNVNVDGDGVSQSLAQSNSKAVEASTRRLVSDLFIRSIRQGCGYIV